MKRNEQAVSPVIGVILMVAITVILAAVIAAFVFGMSGQIQKTKIVDVSLSRTGTNAVTAINHGGQDVGTLAGVYFTVNGANATITASGIATTGGVSSETLLPRSGNTLPVGGSGVITAGVNSHIVGIGQFTDGSNQVLIDTTI